MTGVYGEPSCDNKARTYRLLRDLHAQPNLPWVAIGDFNEILYNHEKRGGPPWAQNQMGNFRAALYDCGLQDLGCIGDKYNWRNHSHVAANYIKERLDRAVASRSWCMRFPAYKVLNGDPYHSDHRPVIVYVERPNSEIIYKNTAHMFRFEAKWLQEEECQTIVNNAWAKASLTGGQSTSEMLKAVAHDLQD